MRRRNSTSVVSIKLTDRRRGVGPQYLLVRAAIRAGVRTSPRPIIADKGPVIGAFIGLTAVASWADCSSAPAGRVCGVHSVTGSPEVGSGGGGGVWPLPFC